MKVDISRRQRQVMFWIHLKKKIDLIIDSGQSDFGIESTIIDLSSKK